MAGGWVKLALFVAFMMVEVAGLAGLGLGVSWYMKISGVVEVMGKTNDQLSFMLMGVGSVASIVGFLGCYGAVAETVWMLIVFGIVMILLVASKVACVVLYFSRKDLFESIMDKAAPLEDSVKKATGSQWAFAGVCAGAAAFEITAMTFAFYLVHNIRLDAKNKNKE